MVSDMSNLRNVNVSFQDTPYMDAFGRLRVSQVTKQFGAKQIYDNLPLYIDTVVNGAGTAVHTPSLAKTTLSTVNAGDYVIVQTKRRFYYSEGSSQEIYMTMYDMHPSVDTIKRLGYYCSSSVAPYTDNLDGFFLEASNGTHYLRVYRNGTLTAERERSQWNDPLDGTGASGVNFNFEFNTIFQPDFEWLGVGRIRFSIVNRGAKITFHEFDYTNGGSGGVTPNFKGVYMTSGNQPLRWEIRQTGATPGTMSYVCSTVGTEGNLNTLTQGFGIDRGTSALAASSTGVAYASQVLRLRSDRLSTTVNIESLSLKSTTNDDYYWQLRLNPTIAGALTFNLVDGSLEVANGATANTVTGGYILGTGLVAANIDYSAAIDNAIKLGSYINGNRDIIALTIIPLSAGLSLYTAINWSELI